MAVQTPIAGSYRLNVNGDHREEYSRFASVTSGDTFTTGLTAVFNFQALGGNTAMAAAISGSTVTFNATATNVKLCVHGY